ncbi:MAG: NAD(P)-dependent oxidoreductase [Bacteroidaceae bacterium]|nr:NAD(P)-dependent oxidoreductase [Bacteroidaceae bacterium]
MKTYVITGATSFIGSQLVQHLLREGHRVIAVVRNHPKAVSKLGAHPQLQLVEADMDDYGRLAEQIPQADVFVHFAWAGTGHDGRNVEEIQQSNIRCTLAAMQAAAQMGCALFVDSGSQAEYGTQLGRITEDTPCQPFSAYGKAKLEVWNEGKSLSQQLGIRYLHLRIFSLFGVGDHPWTLVMTCITRMMRNEPVELSPCTQQWNFLHVADAAEQIASLCQYALSSPTFQQEIFNIASDDTRQLRDFVEEIKRLTHSESELRYGAIQPANLVTLNPDITKTKEATHWQSTRSFDQTICDIVNAEIQQKTHRSANKNAPQCGYNSTAV